MTIAYQAALGRVPERRNIDTGAFFVTASALNSAEIACSLAPYLAGTEQTEPAAACRK